MRGNWLDRAIAIVAPVEGLRRMRARAAAELLGRYYEAAADTRRTENWRRIGTDANAATGPYLAKLRNATRDLVRNNPYAESALAMIVDQAVSWGIVPTVEHAAFAEWSTTTACDADGRHDLAGLQKLVMRTVVESGEALVRRRWRRLEDRLPLPFQLQVLEPDLLDTTKDGQTANGGRIIQGVEFDPLGRRAAYWLYRTHPGSTSSGGWTSFGVSNRVPAEDVTHVFKPGRAGQVRGVPWFAPVLLRFRDFDEFEDATLMKQKIAACLAVLMTDPSGENVPLGRTDANKPETDTLAPGMIVPIPPGKSVDIVQPPNVGDYDPYTRNMLRAIATGIGISYEDLTGDFTNLPFSAARMSRLRQWSRVEDWRWRLLVPLFLGPVWTWAMQAAEIAGLPIEQKTDWTAPPLPMIEPDKEGLAIMRNIRSGITTLSEELRARGYNPEKFLDELQEDFAELDRRRLVLDCDPRKMTQAGQAQGSKLASTPAADDAKNEAKE